MMVKDARSPCGVDIVYVSLVLRTSRVEMDFPKPVLLGQLVEKFVPLPRRFEGSL